MVEDDLWRQRGIIGGEQRVIAICSQRNLSTEQQGHNAPFHQETKLKQLENKTADPHGVSLLSLYLFLLRTLLRVVATGTPHVSTRSTFQTW